jgi:adenylate cyclase
VSGEALRQRLAAILAADAVGYSRLMAADERATVAALDAGRAVFRREIEANQGRVIDMAGDSVLAVFELGTAAVIAALAIQNELAAASKDVPEDRRMRFRIGLHLGEIIEKVDGTVYGDGVNIAARLESLAEPGGVTVSDSVRNAVRGKVDVGFDDNGEQTMKNIADPVRAFALRHIGGDRLQPTPKAGEIDLSLRNMPSIAVLPFTNISGDPEQTYFADGMAEDIITLLASIPNLFVIARNSTFAYKGRSPDVREVAKDLGARYVLEGSVRKSGNRIRVTAQFIDAQSGNYIWAERYDRDLEDIFAVQDEVAQGIVGALQSRLLLAEARLVSRKAPEALDAWGNIVQAKVKLFAYRRSDLDEAEPFARRAINIDSNYGLAHAVLGHILSWRSYQGWTDDWYKAAKDSVLHCERAMALAPDDPGVRADVGFAYLWLGRFRKALEVLEPAASLNPNSAITCARYGEALAICGDAEAALKLVRHAIRLSPKDPLGYMMQQSLAQAEFFAGHYQSALEASNRALQGNSELVLARMFRVAACVKLGRHDEARELLKRFEQDASSRAVDNIFRPRTEGTVWSDYTNAIRVAMDREPQL